MRLLYNYTKQLQHDVLPTLLTLSCQHNIELCFVEPEPGVTTVNMFFNNSEECGQHNIVQSCF